MKSFEQIQIELDFEFDAFLTQVLRINGVTLPYFYWTASFFERVGKLKFSYFYLSNDAKDEINKLGKNYFEDTEVYFEVNKNSHRNDIIINKIQSLFQGANKVGQKSRYEYVKEFVFWKILNASSNIVDNEVIDAQRKNFLITYLSYKLETEDIPSSEVLNIYSKFIETTKGQKELQKIKQIDDNASKNEESKNEELLYRINRLYVLRAVEHKLHFIFSKHLAEDKEELRELLDIMGQAATGNLFRGQASSFWQLDSSIRREARFVENEIEMYYEILSLKPDAFVNDHSIYERLITMQHYGMPTRLMDVTRNPLVAIFFACNNLQETESDGMVFSFNPSKQSILNFEDSLLDDLKFYYCKKGDGVADKDGNKPKLFENIYFIKGIAKNQRINNQSGDFIFIGDSDKVKEELSALPIKLIVIDACTKKVLLEQLESLNIHGGSVYPDLSHMSNFVKNKYIKTTQQTHVSILNHTDTRLFNGKNKKTSENSLIEGFRNISQSEFNSVWDQLTKKKETMVEELISDFDSNTFWTPERESILQSFAENKELNRDNLKVWIDSYIYTDGHPVEDDLRSVFTKKIKLKELIFQKEKLRNSVIELIEVLKKEK